MKSHNISTLRKGFSLIEIITVIAIFGVLAAIGIIVGLDSYARYNFRSELDTATAMLQRARSEAINNISATPHGVYFADLQNLILFAGNDYAHRNSNYDLKIEKAKAAIYSGSSEVVFSQLAGTTTPSTVTIGDGIRSATITISNEWGINY